MAYRQQRILWWLCLLVSVLALTACQQATHPTPGVDCTKILQGLEVHAPYTLHSAVVDGQLPRMKCLLQAGVDPNQGLEGRSPLYLRPGMIVTIWIACC